MSQHTFEASTNPATPLPPYRELEIDTTKECIDIQRLFEQHKKVSDIGDMLSRDRQTLLVQRTSFCAAANEFVSKSHFIKESSNQMVLKLQDMVDRARQRTQGSILDLSNLHELEDQLSNDLSRIEHHFFQMREIISKNLHHEYSLKNLEESWTVAVGEFVQLLPNNGLVNWATIPSATMLSVTEPEGDPEEVPQCARIFFDIKGKCRLLSDRMREMKTQLESSLIQRSLFEEQERPVQTETEILSRFQREYEKVRESHEKQTARLEFWESACQDQKIDLPALQYSIATRMRDTEEYHG